MTDSISIIVPTLGNFENLERLINSLAQQSLIKSKYEILIVVNGPVKDSLRNKLQAWGELHSEIMALKVFFISARGVNRARNYGLSIARFAVALFLDDDCEIQNQHFLAEHIQFHNQRISVFAAGGGYLLPYNSGYFDEIYNYLQMKWYFSGGNENGMGKKTHYLLGGNFSIKLEMAKLNKLSFDESIVYGGSEYEFFKSADIVGLEMLMNELDVIHYTRESLWGLTRKIYKQGQGKAHIDGKYKEVPLMTNKITAERINRADKIVKIYFNYVFWIGYYFYQSRFFTIIPHIAKDVVNKLNFVRYRVLNKIVQQMGDKKDKGDRF